MIPVKINLAGLSIETVYNDNMIRDHKMIGESIYHLQQIVMDAGATPDQTTEQSYIHEVVHWILFVMNEYDLRTNEKFVDVFAHLLFQALSSGLNQIGVESQIKENPDGPVIGWEK